MSDDMALTQYRGNAAVKLAAVLAWFALLLQLYLILAARWQGGKSLWGGVDIFFSYFTVLTNILVAVVLTYAATTGRSALRSFFLRTSVQGGVAAAIVLVGLVYNLLLRDLWDPQGWQWVADELLHDVMPVVFMIYWWFCVPKGLRWSNAWSWLIYPLAYLIYTLGRGYLIDAYPYPFMEVNRLGYMQVFGNAVLILLGFLVISLVVIALDRVKGAR